MAENKKYSQWLASNPLDEFNGNEIGLVTQGGSTKGFLYSKLKTWLQTAFNSVYTVVADFLELEDRVDSLEKITSSLILYLDHSSSDISGYEQLLRTPLTTTLVTETVTINANEVLIDNYATILDFPGQTTIPAGVWTMHGNFQFSSVTGDNYIHWDVYKRTDTGTETLLFRMSSPDVTSTDEDIILVQAAQSEVILADDDRLVLKIYAETTGASKTASMFYSNGEKFGFIQPPAFTVTLDHANLLNVEAAGTGVTDGHITDAAQDIYGLKSATGTSAIDGTAPVRIRIKDLQNSSTWTDGAELMSYEFYSSDESGSGAGVKAKISAITEDTLGFFIGLGFYVNNGTSTFLASKYNKNGHNVLVITPPTAVSTYPIIFRNPTTGILEQRTQLKQTTITSSATPTPTGDARENELFITALAVNTVIAAPSGTAVKGNTLLIRIQDNGTARALAFNAIFEAVGVTLPTTTVVSKKMYIGCIYNNTDTKWDVVSVINEA